MISAAAIVAAGVGLVPGVANAAGPDDAKGTGGRGISAPDLDLTKAETFGSKSFKSPAAKTVHPAAKGKLAPQAENGAAAVPPTVDISGWQSSAHGITLELAVNSDPGTPLGVLVEWGDGTSEQVGANGPTVLTRSHVYSKSGVYHVQVSLLSGDTVVGTNDVIADTAGSDFTPHAPTRLLDTREGIGATKQKVNAYGTTRVKVGGNGQIPAGVTAVALNVTVTNPSKPGHIRAYGQGDERPTTSNVNFTAGQTVPNAVIVPVGANGYVELYNHSDGAVDLIADVTGFFTKSAANGYTSLNPSRLVDTRDGLGTGKGKVAGRNSFTTQVTGRGGVPADAKAVALNVTVTDPSQDGHLIVYPAGGQAPTTSNVNFSTGQTIANSVIVPVGADGKISVFNGAWAGAHVIVDVVGYYSPGSQSAYVPFLPERWFDTREDGEQLEGRNYIYSSFFEDDADVTGVVLNTTVTNTRGPGHLTVAPDPNRWIDYENGWYVDPTPPNSSVLNWTPNKTVPNLVQASTGNTRLIDFWNMSFEPTDVIVDIFGIYAKN
ncbi:hypothetical protein [Streptomyces sp. NPDC059979]|uniref:hypothetical protein n=1 Tax=unclassified Streptomyces TaxID=2593676 RepID=UPI00366172F1